MGAKLSQTRRACSQDPSSKKEGRFEGLFGEKRKASLDKFSFDTTHRNISGPGSDMRRNEVKFSKDVIRLEDGIPKFMEYEEDADIVRKAELTKSLRFATRLFAYTVNSKNNADLNLPSNYLHCDMDMTIIDSSSIRYYS